MLHQQHAAGRAAHTQWIAVPEQLRAPALGSIENGLLLTIGSIVKLRQARGTSTLVPQVRGGFPG